MSTVGGQHLLQQNAGHKTLVLQGARHTQVTGKVAHLRQ
jgi:hypothetical protein